MEQDKTIRLGRPSYVWGFGQERRLDLVRRYVSLKNRALLDVGCGLGAYVRAFRRFSDDVYGVDLDEEKVVQAGRELPNLSVALAEALPYSSGTFDLVLSHEVIEHVSDDRQAIAEAVRVLRSPSMGRSPASGLSPGVGHGPGLASPGTGPSSGGRLVIFAPNRLYPFETHGIYWRGHYRFGNIPLVNYLPDRWRKKLCPHVRAYTRRDLRKLLAGLPVKVVVHRQIFPGYDKIVHRHPALGRVLRAVTYFLEHTPLRAFGLSHLLIVEKSS